MKTNLKTALSGLVVFVVLSFSSPVPAKSAPMAGEGPNRGPVEAQAQTQASTQVVPAHSGQIVGSLYVCDVDNDHGATAQFVPDGHAGLVPNLNVLEHEGWNQVQAGIDFAFPPGGIFAGPNRVTSFQWKPTHGTVAGCNQGLYIFFRYTNPPSTQIVTQLFPITGSGFTTTGPDADGYFTTSNPYFANSIALEQGLITTDGGNFNVKSYSFGVNKAVFAVPGGNHKRPTSNLSCPFGTNHASITVDDYCGI
jgi:hypothetical protein